MEEHTFFKWARRVNSILFLMLLLLFVGLMLYGFFESSKWGERNKVEIKDGENTEDLTEDLRLSSIIKVCGKDVQYVELNASPRSKGFSYSDYSRITRNIVFFVGPNLDSHWLFDTNTYLISKIDQLMKGADKCNEKETVAIYYEIRKDDTDKNGKLDENDLLTVALTSPDGNNYKEIEVGLTSVLDHSIDADTSVLTLLVQNNGFILMKKYSLKTNEKIAEKEITRIGKKL